MLDFAPMDEFMQAAMAEARKGLDAGGVPIGSVLVIDGAIVGRGHNQRVQKGSAVLHAEMDCLENAGRLCAADYRRALALADNPREQSFLAARLAACESANDPG